MNQSMPGDVKLQVSFQWLQGENGTTFRYSNLDFIQTLAKHLPCINSRQVFSICRTGICFLKSYFGSCVFMKFCPKIQEGGEEKCTVRHYFNVKSAKKKSFTISILFWIPDWQKSKFYFFGLSWLCINCKFLPVFRPKKPNYFCVIYWSIYHQPSACCSTPS